MVFLKRFYAEGFKSFAEPINLNFEEKMIGIVGPNGSGKSNIVDALKWTIGEQSIKALRGKEKSNLIFMGSQTMPEADFAMITLTFNNSDRVLHYDADEVTVTRKLIRKTGESLFFINDEPVRLKDIQDIFLDTGLSKGSLGIISQGTVSWFAEAKPEERRKMFEEAAGIGRYTKRKNEALDLLEKSTNHLLRVQDIIYTLEKELKQLEKQAEKAKLYKEKKETLERMDVSLMVQDLLQWNDEQKLLDSDVESYASKVEKIRLKLTENEALYNDAQTQFTEADLKASQLQEKKDHLIQQVHSLEQRQLLFNSNLEEKLNSDNKIERASSYKNLIITTQTELDNVLMNLNGDEANYEDVKYQYNSLLKQKEELDSERQTLIKTISTKQAQLNFYISQQNDINASERGVNTILKNKDAIPGIYGTIASLLKVPSKYEIAIQTALGRTVSNIVVEKKENALNAINFLKRNNAGRATFLPLDTIKPKSLKPESVGIVKQINGFIDVASNLVSIDSNLKIVIDYLLGNIIIADNIENAAYIAQMTYQAYKVISLDGDVNFAGGAIQGGAQKHNITSSFNLDEKIANLSEEIKTLNDQMVNFNVNFEKVNAELTKANMVLQAKTVSISGYKARSESLEALVARYKNEFEALTQTSFEDVDKVIDENTIQKELLDLQNQQKQINEQLNLMLETKTIYQSKAAKFQYDLNDLRVNFDNLNAKLSVKSARLMEMKNNIANAEDRIISMYQMTVETAMQRFKEPLDIPIDVARAEVKRLKSEIDALGSINMAAVEELEKRQKEYEIQKQEHEDAKKAVDEMKSVIDELDKRAKNDFTRIINRVNQIMPSIFKDLFGGGNCAISYTDPNNILETGIEVIVHPPGKKVSNLVLLSGGEKTLVALSVLFAILKSSSFPLVVLDEAEAALDQYNVDVFAKIIKDYSDNTQFMIITHRPGTMKTCDVLYGTTMQNKGVTRVVKTDLNEIKDKLEPNAQQDLQQEGA